MPVKFLILFLCFSPVVLMAKQDLVQEQDLELFEFLALYEKDDAVFIDAEMDDKTEHTTLTSKQENMSGTNE